MPWGFRWLRWGREDPFERIASEWRETIDAIEWPILTLHADGRISRVNRAAQRLAGLDFPQLLDRPVEALGSWQPWRAIAELAPAVAETRSTRSRHVTGDRGKAWQITASFCPSPSFGGNRVIVVARDVTVVAQLEAQLRKSETMAEMGTLVSGVAHEVRNPLFAISATVDAVEARLGDREELGPFVATLRGEVERLRRLMQDLLEYGKPSRLDLRDVDIADVVGVAVRACESLAARREVTLRNAVERRLARLRLDPGRLAQALQNLVENAVHHSPAGEAVEIAATALPGSSHGWIELSVADRGPGFRPDDFPRIFEPFFSRRHGGTGLGLSIVKRIAEAHGGAVEAGNGLHGGAIMTIKLPVPDATAEGRADAEGSSSGSRI